MVHVALLAALIVWLVPVSAEAAPSPGCLPAGPLPSEPVATIAPVVSQNVQNVNDRIRFDVWRHPCVDGTTAPTLVRATPLSTAPFMCTADFTVIQGGAQFEAKMQSGFCQSLLVPTTEVILPASTPAFNEAAAYQLVYRGYVTSATLFTFEVPAAPLPATLAGAAVLPGSRAVQVAQIATAFALLQAAPGNTAVGCSIAPTNAPAGTAFTYQQTNAINVPVGTPNTPVDIPGGEFRTFLIALTPSQVFAATDIAFTYDCTNTSPAPDTPGVNRLLLTSSAGPTPDIIAIAVAVGGIVSMPVGGIGALAVASANVGASAPIVVSADTGSTPLPLELTVCQTNPQTAQCLSPAAPSVTTQINAGETPTYTVFGKANGAIAFNPGLHRINLRFRTQAGGTVGSTSVAVQTQ
jgi:hypothetical protein